MQDDERLADVNTVQENALTAGADGVGIKRKFEDLPPAAQRALQEAEQRRAILQAKGEANELPKEYNGRGGLEPTRYNDWEIKGMTSDF